MVLVSNSPQEAHLGACACYRERRADMVILLKLHRTASVFLRRGLAEPIDLEAVLPEDHEDRLYLLEEVEELVAFQRRKRTKQYQNTCRRYAGDVDGDDPVIVEGDGKSRGGSDYFPLLDK